MNNTQLATCDICRRQFVPSEPPAGTSRTSSQLTACDNCRKYLYPQQPLNVAMNTQFIPNNNYSRPLNPSQSRPQNVNMNEPFKYVVPILTPQPPTARPNVNGYFPINNFPRPYAPPPPPPPPQREGFDRPYSTCENCRRTFLPAPPAPQNPSDYARVILGRKPNQDGFYPPSYVLKQEVPPVQKIFHPITGEEAARYVPQKYYNMWTSPIFHFKPNGDVDFY